MKTIRTAQYDYNKYDINPHEDDPPISPVFLNIYLYDPETDEEAEVSVSVDFTVEDTEYVGGHLFLRGGIIVNSVTTEEAVKIGENTFLAGTDINELLPYWGDEGATRENFDKWAISKLSEMGIKPKRSTYPDVVK